MSGEDEGFLNRWSRRKQEVAKETAEETAKTEEQSAVPTEADTPAKPAEEEFDISTLPPIESITAGTDIRAFLSKGVPAALTQAALRKMWSADPAIRDHIGLSEYSWDFNAPGQYGFGAIDPSANIQDMVADVFGKVKEAVAKTDAIAETTNSSPEQLGSGTVSSEPPRSVELRRLEIESGNTRTASESAELQSGDKNAQATAAAQQPNESEAGIPVQTRRHGSALPS